MKNENRIGLLQRKESKKQQNRRYKLHSNLIKHNCKVKTFEKTVILSSESLKINKWANELIKMGYAVQNKLL